jgi:hypothetical protein
MWMVEGGGGVLCDFATAAVLMGACWMWMDGGGLALGFLLHPGSSWFDKSVVMGCRSGMRSGRGWEWVRFNCCSGVGEIKMRGWEWVRSKCCSGMGEIKMCGWEWVRSNAVWEWVNG